MLGAWKVNGGQETRRFSRYTSAVKRSRSIKHSNARRACYFCRTKKLKCSGTAGSCDRCRGLAIKCEYPSYVLEARSSEGIARKDHHFELSPELLSPEELWPHGTVYTWMNGSNDDQFRIDSSGDSDGIHTGDCLETVYSNDEFHSIHRTGTSSTESSDQDLAKWFTFDLAGDPYLNPVDVPASGRVQAPDLGTLSWVMNEAGLTGPFTDRKVSEMSTPEPLHPTESSLQDCTAIPNQPIELCECLRTAANVLHRLSAHLGSSSSMDNTSCEQFLELFNTSARHLRRVIRCALCCFHAENMTVNAMALQQLCMFCEQMSTLAKPDLSCVKSATESHAGQSQIYLERKKALVWGAIIASQSSILMVLVKDFKMVSASRPTPTALLEGIEERVEGLRAAVSK